MFALRDFQRRFVAAILDDSSGVAFAPARIPGDVGLLAHRDNVLGGLTEALATQFPVVRAIVGDAFFGAMAQAFLRLSPPSGPVMIGHGATFASFLASFPPVQSLPYLPDVARLEYAMHEAYHAADQEALDVKALARCRADDLARLTLCFHPSVRLVASEYPVDLIWRYNQLATEPSEPFVLPDRPAFPLIARPGDVVEMTALSEPGFAFLSTMIAGEDLSVAQSRAGDGFDGGPLILDLFARGLITDIAT